MNLKFLPVWLLLGSSLFAADVTAKIYECPFDADAPVGVSAWHTSERVRKGIGRENRFEDYDHAAAQALAADATASRDVDKDSKTSVRETSFWQVYNEKGWYLYIESAEPLMDDLLDDMIDPKSKARDETYEIFFMPGLKEVPYYQLITRPFVGTTDFYDWGMPSRDYRSPKEFAKIESQPLKDGFGTFLFVPWEALYEHLPLEGASGDLRLSAGCPLAKPVA